MLAARRHAATCYVRVRVSARKRAIRGARKPPKRSACRSCASTAFGASAYSGIVGGLMALRAAYFRRSRPSARHLVHHRGDRADRQQRRCAGSDPRCAVPDVLRNCLGNAPELYLILGLVLIGSCCRAGWRAWAPAARKARMTCSTSTGRQALRRPERADDISFGGAGEIVGIRRERRRQVRLFHT
jgi:hypothetical protein